MSKKKCPDCGARMSDSHAGYKRCPSTWAAGDFISVVENTKWRFDDLESARICCGSVRLPVNHAWHAVAPCLLWDLVQDGLPMNVLREVLGITWSRCSVPLLSLTNGKWRKLFDRAGYTFGFVEPPLPFMTAERDMQPRVLYRAAERAHRRNMSWTPNRALAEQYVRQPRGVDTGRSVIWWAVVEPERLLCHILDGVEYVVDTTGLTIRRLDKHEPPDLTPGYIDLALPLPWEDDYGKHYYLEDEWSPPLGPPG